jgi:predicted Zn-dependent peptidase
LAKAKLGGLKRDKPNAYLPAVNTQVSPRVKLHRRKIEQMHMAIGFVGYHEKHQDRYVLNLLSIILAGNMSSRLFVEVREKRGLAYSISSCSKTMHDTGLFLIRAGVDNVKIVQAMEVILKELKKIQHSGVSEGEFQRAKDYVLGQFLLGLEDTMEHMLWLGESVIAKDEMRRPEDVVKEFQSIQRADIKRVAQEIFNFQKLNMAVVGPITPTQERQLQSVVM